ncbi:MAG: thermonuclease family protein [Hyphomicrobiales bacterium]|nr:thermonuclease family protein [Hyphomicrobiales bacterium]
MRRAIAFLFMLCATVPRQAFALDKCVLEDAGAGVVVEIAQDGLLGLDDGRVITLAGVRFPHFAPLGGVSLDVRGAVRAALVNAILGRRVELRRGLRKTDRYGRHIAYVRVSPGGEALLQAWLVERGVAVADTSGDGGACAGQLLAAEDKARKFGAGFWGAGLFAVRSAEDAQRLRQLIGAFQIVEGEVTAVDEAKSRGAMLTVGARGSAGVKVILPKRRARGAEAGVMSAADLAGRRIRVRGWIEYRAGPAITVTNMEQIEVVAAAAE